MTWAIPFRVPPDSSLPAVPNTHGPVIFIGEYGKTSFLMPKGTMRIGLSTPDILKQSAFHSHGTNTHSA